MIIRRIGLHGISITHDGITSLINMSNVTHIIYEKDEDEEDSARPYNMVFEIGDSTLGDIFINEEELDQILLLVDKIWSI